MGKQTYVDARAYASEANLRYNRVETTLGMKMCVNLWVCPLKSQSSRCRDRSDVRAVSSRNIYEMKG